MTEVTREAAAAAGRRGCGAGRRAGVAGTSLGGTLDGAGRRAGVARAGAVGGGTSLGRTTGTAGRRAGAATSPLRCPPRVPRASLARTETRTECPHPGHRTVFPPAARVSHDQSHSGQTSSTGVRAIASRT